MTAPLLLGLTGHVGTGKDTVGTILQTEGWRCTSFAEALRIEVASTWHVDPRLLTDRATKEVPLPSLAAGMVHSTDWLRWAAVQGHSLTSPRSPRWALQQWGSYRRSQRPLHWVEHVLVWLATLRRQHPHTSCVITDVRFTNEAEALRQRGGHIVRVHRPHTGQQLAPDTARHESEAHTQITADADLVNDGSFYDLALEVRRVVHQFDNPTAAASGIDA
jgi:hypothetical protein